MGKRGPQPKPTSQRQAEGNLGHKKINRDEPVFIPAQMDPPDFLEPEAKSMWQTLAPDLIKNGLLSAADVQAFASYCAAWSDFKRATAGLIATGDILDNDMLSPFIRMRRNAMQDIIRIGGHFGLSPSTRSGITAAKPVTENPMAKFFNKPKLIPRPAKPKAKAG